MIRESAYAKVNLVLHVGFRRRGRLHELCSLFASLDLADEVSVSESADGRDSVSCPGVEEENLAVEALAAFRGRAVDAPLPPLAVRIDKRIPVAAGLGGGSADAAAVLRAANELAGQPLDAPALRRVAAGLGSDVPSQVEPRHALVVGTGDRVEPLALPAMTLVLVPSRQGLATADVYAELDRLGRAREKLDPEPLRRLAAAPLTELAAGMENDLQAAALSLRPDLERTLCALREAGALASLIAGSGPTAFGVFEDRKAAERAAAELPGGLVTETRPA